jgi:transcriptional regulator with XRE-family HTH domain
MAEHKEPCLFGKRVRLIRERRRWSQDELAARAGVSYNSVWRVENGTRQTPNLAIAARLAKALSTSLDWLAGIYDEPEPGG